MTTENRSSNTEMVSVPREPTREMLNGVCMHPDLARSLWSALLKNAPQPAEQYQGELEVLFLKSGYLYHSDGKPALTDENVGYVRADQVPHADTTTQSAGRAKSRCWGCALWSAQAAAATVQVAAMATTPIRQRGAESADTPAEPVCTSATHPLRPSARAQPNPSPYNSSPPTCAGMESYCHDETQARPLGHRRKGP